jgi:hypothetical protein
MNIRAESYGKLGIKGTPAAGNTHCNITKLPYPLLNKRGTFDIKHWKCQKTMHRYTNLEVENLFRLHYSPGASNWTLVAAATDNSLHRYIKPSAKIWKVDTNRRPRVPEIHSLQWTALLSIQTFMYVEGSTILIPRRSKISVISIEVIQPFNNSPNH